MTLLALLAAVAAEMLRLIPFWRDGDYLIVSVVGVVVAVVVILPALRYVLAPRHRIEVDDAEVRWFGGVCRWWVVDRAELRSVIIAEGGRSAPRRDAWRLAMVDSRGLVVCLVKDWWFEPADRDALVNALGLPVTRQNWPGQFSEITEVPHPAAGRLPAAALSLLAFVVAGAILTWGAVAEFGGARRHGTAAAAPGTSAYLQPDLSSVPIENNPVRGRPTCSGLAHSEALTQDVHVRPSTAKIPPYVPDPGSRPVVECRSSTVEGGTDEIVVWRTSASTYTAQLTAVGWQALGFGGFQRADGALALEEYGPYLVVVIYQ